MSHRKRDSRVEKEISKFMDEQFYSNKVKDFIRFEDLDNQLKGKDVSFTLGKLKNILVDEKAQSQYINKNLPTFAFEISFIRSSGDWTLGWLFDTTKENNYFILIWPFASKDWNITKEDIIKLDCLLIDKLKIQKFLEKEGFNINTMLEEEKRIREHKLSGKINNSVSKYVYFYKTDHLSEKPVNIVIRKEKLIELAELKFTVQ